MKMRKEHYDKLALIINEYASKIEYKEYRKQYRDFGYSETRFRWDLFWANHNSSITDMLAYLNDDHIDTALRRIVKSLDEKYGC